MTAERWTYLQALSDIRSWHRWQIGQSVGDVRAMEAHKMAIAWIDEVIEAKTRRAAEDEAARHDRQP